MRKLLEELYSRFYQDIYRYLYSLSADASLAEDLASEVFLEAVKSIVTFQGESDIRTWLFSIARHRWLGYLRKKKRSVPTERISPDYPDWKKSLETQYEDKEAAQRIQAVLREEPERTRKILKMRMEGYSFREIGDLLGISENSARVIEFRVKKRIREILRKEGLADE